MQEIEILVKLEFRQALPSDVGEMFVVCSRTRDSPMSKEQLAERGITPEAITAHIASGRIRGWVCSRESDLVGFCNADRENGEILVLAVLPEYEGKGIGTTLPAHAVGWLQSVGFNTPWLAASPDVCTRAHGFYRSLGWRPNSKIDDTGDEILVL